MANNFSKKSLEALNTCHPDLMLILMVSLGISDVDFGISEGERPLEKQQQYFNEGKSKIDGITKKGKHNMKPSWAADYYPLKDGKAYYDNETLSYLSGIFKAVSELLFRDGKITHKIRWGGNWDMDGVILVDQTFDDRPHIELINA